MMELLFVPGAVTWSEPVRVDEACERARDRDAMVLRASSVKETRCFKDELRVGTAISMECNEWTDRRFCSVSFSFSFFLSLPAFGVGVVGIGTGVGLTCRLRARLVGRVYPSNGLDSLRVVVAALALLIRGGDWDSLMDLSPSRDSGRTTGLMGVVTGDWSRLLPSSGWSPGPSGSRSIQLTGMPSSSSSDPSQKETSRLEGAVPGAGAGG